MGRVNIQKLRGRREQLGMYLELLRMLKCGCIFCRTDAYRLRDKIYHNDWALRQMGWI